MNQPVWSPYQPSQEMPWNSLRVIHLHRRAGFATTWANVQRDLRDGPEKSIDRLLAGKTSAQRDDFHEMSEVIGDAAASSGDPKRLKAWWLFRILFSADPLREKLTLLWHNHFVIRLC